MDWGTGPAAAPCYDVDGLGLLDADHDDGGGYGGKAGAVLRYTGPSFGRKAGARGGATFAFSWGGEWGDYDGEAAGWCKYKWVVGVPCSVEAVRGKPCYAAVNGQDLRGSGCEHSKFSGQCVGQERGSSTKVGVVGTAVASVKPEK